jgi:hypothetical protein
LIHFRYALLVLFAVSIGLFAMPDLAFALQSSCGPLTGFTAVPLNVQQSIVVGSVGSPTACDPGADGISPDSSGNSGTFSGSAAVTVNLGGAYTYTGAAPGSFSTDNINLFYTPTSNPGVGYAINLTVYISEDGGGTFHSETVLIEVPASGPTATQAIASKALTQNHAATSFTPVTGSGGTAPLSYSVSPTLPTGLSMASGTGAITGTPTVTSTATTYTVTVRDASSATATNTFSLTVNSAVTATQVIPSTTLTQNHAATSFTPVTGSGGTTPLSYSVLPNLPTGLSMASSTGAITGTPTVTSSATTYTVTVTDANSATATNSFSLTVNAAVTATQAIASTTLTQNHAATSFTPVTGSGGTSPLSYSVSPSLPTGLSLASSTGAITGTPTVTSSATTYTVTVTDANSATATATFSLTVIGAVTATQAIASTTLTQNHAATSFTPVTGSGGTSPLSYSVSPSLPTGLSMASVTGAITGTPTVASSATTYTVTVIDANSATATATFSLTVTGAVTATQAIASAVLTQNHAATSFTPVTGSGGTAPLSYSVSPSLPTGLSMASSTGAITGTPTATSSATTYTVTVTDANSATATATFSLTVNAAVTATQAVASAVLTQNHAATSFTPVTGSGGTAPLSYSISPGLPTGLSMASGTGAITGTPTVASSATTYTVTVTDANSATATATFSLTVTGAVTATQAIASTTLTQNHAATSFTPVTGSGGTAPLSYSVSPTLPTGLSMASSTGAITGTPTVTSSATTYTVTVTDANSATGTATFSLTVIPPGPTVSSVSPVSGPTAGGTSVTISGGNFTGASAVTFGGVAATSFTVNSAAQISATAPAHAVGAVDVAITTPGGSVTSSGAYTYVAVLTLTSTPSALAQLGQTYSQTNVAGGGTSPYTYSISAGAVPAGTTFSTTTGLVSGTPTAAGGFSYTVKVTDSGATPQTSTQAVSGSITTGITSTTISSSLNPSQVGQAVSFSATVTGSGSTPTGTVTFKDGGIGIGTATLAAGIATFSTKALTLGSHTITASYAGNGTFSASTSPGLVEVVSTPADSLKLRAMQVQATKLVAQNSGQAISGAIDTAIADGFSDGGNFITPGGGGMHFNFTSDPDEQASANSGSRVSDRWNGPGRRDGANAANPMGVAAVNGPVRGQASSRIDDAFASIDRAAIATKGRARMVEPKEWMLWADVSGSGINRWGSSGNSVTSTGSTEATLYGWQVNALLGLTRKVNPAFLVGVLGGYETFDYRADALAGRLKGEGWTVGSYLGWKLTPNIRFTAAIAYSGITYDGSAGTANGNFDGNRWLVSSGLVGTYQLDRLQIEPSATVYALWEHENAYTDSLGTLQDGRSFFSGRAAGGGRLIYPLDWTSTVTLAPYLGLYGDYYFNADDAAAAAVAGSVPLASTPILAGWSARATAGVAARFGGGATLAFGAELGGLGSSIAIWTFRGRGSIPF